MEFDFSATVPAPVDAVWAIIEDVPVVALCIPGVIRVEAQGEGRYSGALQLKVGPISLELGGIVTVEELDCAAYRLRFLGEAKDRRVPGQLKSRATLTLIALPEGGTGLAVHSETHLLGKIGEFGQPVIRKKTGQILAEFTANLARKLAPA